MASTLGFVKYVAEQLQDAGKITYRRMFGEYGLYCNGIFFSVVCDDQFFVKITSEGENALPYLPKSPPYKGARDYFLVEDIDDRELMEKLAKVTCSALQTPKPKKRRD